MWNIPRLNRLVYLLQIKYKYSNLMNDHYAIDVVLQSSSKYSIITSIV